MDSWLNQQGVNVIRFAPPLVMTEDQLLDCIKIITSTIKEFEPK